MIEYLPTDILNLIFDELSLAIQYKVLLAMKNSPAKHLTQYVKRYLEMLLIESVRQNDDPERTMSLIKSGVDVNTTDHNGYTSLMFACEDYSSNYDVISALLDAGADVNIKTIHGDTALILMAYTFQMFWMDEAFYIIKKLLKAGADVNSQNSDGYTALILSCQYDDALYIVKELIKYDADVNVKTNDGWTPLITATFFNQIELVDELLYAGVNECVKTSKGETAMSIAIKEKYIDIINLLK